MIYNTEKIDLAYKLLSAGEIDTSLKSFLELIKEIFLEKNFNKEIVKILIRSYSGIGEIFQKKGDLEKSLKYYLEANKFAKDSNFDIVFNIGVLYKNIGNNNLSDLFINKALFLDKNNALLENFRKSSAENISDKEEYFYKTGNKINQTKDYFFLNNHQSSKFSKNIFKEQSYEKKVLNMIEQIKSGKK